MRADEVPRGSGPTSGRVWVGADIARTGACSTPVGTGFSLLIQLPPCLMVVRGDVYEYYKRMGMLEVFLSRFPGS